MTRPKRIASWSATGTTWTEPGGGLFVWVTLPEGIDAARAFAAIPPGKDVDRNSPASLANLSSDHPESWPAVVLMRWRRAIMGGQGSPAVVTGFMLRAQDISIYVMSGFSRLARSPVARLERPMFPPCDSDHTMSGSSGSCALTKPSPPLIVAQ